MPLALAPHLLFYYDVTPKVVIALAGTAMALALVAFHLDSVRAFCGTRLGKVYTGATFLFVSTLVLSTILSPDRALAWNGSNWRRSGALVEIGIMAGAWLLAVCSRNAMPAILKSFCAAGILAALYGIAQYFGWDPFLDAQAYRAGEGPFQIVRPPGPLGHSDYFAAWLLWPVFGGASMLSGAGPRPARYKFLAWTAIITCVTAILLSGSRGALAGLVTGAIVLAVLTKPPLRVSIPITASVLLLTAILYLSPAGALLRSRVRWINEEPAGGARFLIWRDSLKMSATRPLTGFGPDVFVAEFPQYQSVELAQAFPSFYHESPHNLFLDTLTAQGMLGLLAQLAIIATALIAAARRRDWLLAALCATLAAHQFAVLTPANTFYLYLVTALVVSSGVKIHAPAPAPKLLKPLVLVAASAAAILLIVPTYRLLAADLALGAATRHLDHDNPQAAAESYRRAADLRSTGVTADLQLSRRWADVAAKSPDALSKLYFAQLAAASASLATQDPENRPNAWYSVAQLAASRSDANTLETALRSAIQASPNWYQPHRALAQFLDLQGRQGDAALEARLALRLSGDKDPDLAAVMDPILRSGAARR